MPGYGGEAQAALLRSNRQVFLFKRELITPPVSSIAIQLERISRTYYPWGASFQLSFTDVNGIPADPGAFEVDIESSDIDEDAQYCMINQFVGLSSLNAQYVGRIELPMFWARYVRAAVASLTNPVYVSVLATR